MRGAKHKREQLVQSATPIAVYCKTKKRDGRKYIEEYNVFMENQSLIQI